MSPSLSVADLQFINRVASRRFTGGEPAAMADPAALEAALAASSQASGLQRPATLVAKLLRDDAFATAPLQTALLALHCWLASDGLSLLAPQGVLVGMVRSLAAGGDVTAFQHWLEDRTVPSASGD